MHAITASRRAKSFSRKPLLAALLFLICSLLFFWPGIAEYDTIVQYQQLLTRSYDDWHPPVMARLWSLLSFSGPGAAPLFVLQIATYWLGLGLLAQALGGRKAIALLLIGANPLLLGWLAIVIKDSQAIGALALATGIIGTYRLRNRPLPVPALLIAILCLAYATLLRANAAFSTVPLTMLLIPYPRNGLARLAVTVAAIPAVLLLSQPINHGLLGARDSGVRRTQPIYDLAAIAVRTGDAPSLPPQAAPSLAAHHCVLPLFWDPLGDAPDCAALIRAWDKAPVGPLYRLWASAALAHPVAYLAHRLAHLNSTERWLIPYHWPLAAPPAHGEPNRLGLASPANPLVIPWQKSAGWLTEMPVAWPIFWVVAALWGLWNLRGQPPSAPRDLALALFTSALFQEASFLALSISSDLRYHLWAMMASALGWLILWPPRPSLRATGPAILAFALLILSGTAARVMLPPPTAQDMGQAQ
ncbi:MULTISPECIES: hypothetical protein [Sphingobium]|uniref:hypothetical protein n=1 Tax=Sphingobium TaxID=165695 RepID=UPI0021019B30|nr:hypothetical protein [Sphingobium sp. 15-1]